jgi:hypothetical protein
MKNKQVFKEGDKVLCRNSARMAWRRSEFAGYTTDEKYKERYPYTVKCGYITRHCILYKGNEHLEGVRGRQNLTKGKSE